MFAPNTATAVPLRGGAELHTPDLAIIDKLLANQNLKAIHTYPYEVGDCAFDSIAFLTEYTWESSVIRTLAMREFRQSTEPIDMALFQQQITVHPNHDALDYHTYTKLMGQPSSKGGLWGDHLAIHWAGLALGKLTGGCQIEGQD